MTSLYRFDRLFIGMLLFILVVSLFPFSVQAEAIEYAVKRGDTAWKIYQQHYEGPVTLQLVEQRILSRNGIADAHLLPVGKILSFEVPKTKEVLSVVSMNDDHVTIGINQLSDRIGQASVTTVALQENVMLSHRQYEVLSRELASKENTIDYLTLVIGTFGLLACLLALGALFVFRKRENGVVSQNVANARSLIEADPPTIPRHDIVAPKQTAQSPIAHIRFSFLDGEGIKREGRIFLDRQAAAIIGFGDGNFAGAAEKYRSARQSLQHFFGTLAALDHEWRQCLFSAFKQGYVEVNLD